MFAAPSAAGSLFVGDNHREGLGAVFGQFPEPLIRRSDGLVRLEEGHRLANAVYKSLDGKQRKKALLKNAPPDSAKTVTLRGSTRGLPGLPASELAADQKKLLENTLTSFLSMYRKTDVDEAMACIKKNGGLETLALSFYQAGDLGNDGIWDRWRVEGPAFVWYFRGSPHVHTWVNIAHQAGADSNRKETRRARV